MVKDAESSLTEHGVKKAHLAPALNRECMLPLFTVVRLD